MRTFESGATRNSDEGKPQYARIGDPSIDKAYAAYMNSQRVQADGKLRDPDNWKKGIDMSSYLDSQRRHWHDVWFHMTGRGDEAEEKDLVTALCALKFNVDGMLYEVLKARRFEEAKAQNTADIQELYDLDERGLPKQQHPLSPEENVLNRLLRYLKPAYCEIAHATPAEYDLCAARSAAAKESHPEWDAAKANPAIPSRVKYTEPPEPKVRTCKGCGRVGT
jgi:hypothetical protein